MHNENSSALKICRICNRALPVEDFYSASYSHCKECHRAQVKEARKRRKAEAQFIKHNCSVLDKGRLVALISFILTQYTNNLADQLEFMELKPALKDALINELLTTKLIYESQLLSEIQKLPTAIAIIDTIYNESEVDA